MEGKEGEEGWIHPQVLLKNEFLTYVYSLETPKFVVTTKRLELSAFTEWEPCGYN